MDESTYVCRLLLRAEGARSVRMARGPTRWALRLARVRVGARLSGGSGPRCAGHRLRRLVLRRRERGGLGGPAAAVHEGDREDSERNRKANGRHGMRLYHAAAPCVSRFGAYLPPPGPSKDRNPHAPHAQTATRCARPSLTRGTGAGRGRRAEAQPKGSATMTTDRDDRPRSAAAPRRLPAPPPLAPRRRRPLRPPDQALEPEDAPVHLRRAQRHPHHRPRPDGAPLRARVQLRRRRPSAAAATCSWSAPSARRRRSSRRRRRARAATSSSTAGSAARSRTSAPSSRASSACASSSG